MITLSQTIVFLLLRYQTKQMEFQLYRLLAVNLSPSSKFIPAQFDYTCIDSRVFMDSLFKKSINVPKVLLFEHMTVGAEYEDEKTLR